MLIVVAWIVGLMAFGAFFKAVSRPDLMTRGDWKLFAWSAFVAMIALASRGTLALLDRNRREGRAAARDDE